MILAGACLLAQIAPSFGQENKVAGAAGTTQEYVFKKTPQGDLKMYVHFPKNWKSGDKRPAIVFFFGGAWRMGSAAQFIPQAEYFAGRGLVTARADYRIQSKHRTTPDKCVEDARSAIRWVRRNAAALGVDSDRIVGSGGSAGGHIAACAALIDGFEAKEEEALTVSSRPNILVLFNPVFDLRAMKIPDMNGQDVAKAISPILFLKKDAPPAILFYGSNDKFLEQGRAFLAKSREIGARVELWTAEGQPHGFFNRSPWTEATLQKADEFLVSLGCLKGEPTINVPSGADLKKEK
jgi:acetyl esterase/lipase